MAVPQLVACGAEAPAAPPADEVARDGSPPAEWVDPNGRLFRRVDRWTPEELETIAREGDGRLPSDDVYTLAAQLRAHVLRGGAHYIQVELDFELADRILFGPTPAPTPSAPSLEYRGGVYGADNRTQVGNPTADPNNFRGFSELGCTANLVSRHVAATAAHCLFKIADELFGISGWRCGNGSVGTTLCPPLEWRFGVAGDTGASPWMNGNGCAAIWVTTAYAGLVEPVDGGVHTRWDYGLIDFSGCPSYGMGYFGTIIYSDAQILAKSARIGGYPQFATCPTGANGTYDDCGADVYGPPYDHGPKYRYGTGAGGSFAADTLLPFPGAQIWIGTSSSMSLTPGWTAHIIQTKGDATHGMSGGALVESGNTYLIGILHGMGDANGNLYRRWTSELHQFFDANSVYPPATDP